MHRWLKPEWDGMCRCEPHKHLSASALVHWQIPQMLAASEQHAPFFHQPSNQRRRQQQQQPSGGAARVRLHSETEQSPLHWHTTLSQVRCVSRSPSRKHARARERMQSSGGFSSVACVSIGAGSVWRLHHIMCLVLIRRGGMLQRLPTERNNPDDKTLCSGGCSGLNLCMCVCVCLC